MGILPTPFVSLNPAQLIGKHEIEMMGIDIPGWQNECAIIHLSLSEHSQGSHLR